MARFGDGLGVGADLVTAAGRACADALVPLAGRRPDLAVVFTSGGDTAAAAAALARAAELAGAGSVVGATMPGVIAAGRGVEAIGAVSVWCAVLPDVRVRGFALEALPADAGIAVVGMPELPDDAAAAVLLADPWSFPVDGFVDGSGAALPGLPLVGGLAAGPAGRGSTRLLLDGKVVERGAVGVLLSGPVGVRSIVSQGCRPVGPAMTVTASQGNVVSGLAGAPAMRKLEQVVADLPPEEQALVSAGLQLGIARDEYADEHGHGDFLIRGVAAAAADPDAIVVGDLVPLGRTVRFHVRDAAAADTDLRETLQRFRRRSSLDTVEGALLFSCNGRGAAMFGSPDHDPQLVGEELAATGVAGCFAAGEIGPVAGRNHVHGFTASVLAFGSGAAAARGTGAPPS